MPRTEVNWEALETQQQIVAGKITPADTFDEEIGAEIRRMEGLIATANTTRSRLNTQLVSFSTRAHPTDGFVRHSALLNVLDNHALLDAYYEEEPGNAGHTYANTESGWNMKLRPAGKGVIFEKGAFFEVVFVSDPKTGDGRCTARYKAR